MELSPCRLIVPPARVTAPAEIVADASSVDFTMSVPVKLERPVTVPPLSSMSRVSPLIAAVWPARTPTLVFVPARLRAPESSEAAVKVTVPV